MFINLSLKNTFENDRTFSAQLVLWGSFLSNCLCLPYYNGKTCLF